MDRLEATFRGTIADLRHKRPETAGAPPGTKLTLDTEALDPDLAVRLFRMENGHPVQITISEIQDRLPMDDKEPKPPEGEEEPVPSAFRVGWAPPKPPDPDPNTQPV